MCDWIDKYVNQGREEGMERINQLFKCLLSDGRMDNIRIVHVRLLVLRLERGANFFLLLLSPHLSELPVGIGSHPHTAEE